MGRSTVLLIGFLALAAFAILCVRQNVTAIHDDLTQRGTVALADAAYDWVDLEVDGRDLTLSGTAPDAPARADAIELIRGLYGVRIVHDAMSGPVEHSAAPATLPTSNQNGDELAAIQPYWLSVSRNAGAVVLEGQMPDAAERDALVELARRRFDERIDDRLVLAPNAPAGWSDAAAAGVVLAGALVEGEVALRRHSVFVTGLAGSDASVAEIDAAAAESLPPGYTAQTAVRSVRDLNDLVRTRPELAQRVAEQRRDATAAPRSAATSPATADDAATGCQQRFDALLARSRIGFETGSDIIDARSRQLLDELADVARTCPSSRIEIAGHTDDQGTDANNLRLSQRRAEAVRDYLVIRGIPQRRLVARGYGESRPLVPNRTAEHRARNRRIEFNILDGER